MAICLMKTLYYGVCVLSRKTYRTSVNTGRKPKQTNIKEYEKYNSQGSIDR